jgi:hypothetical protein
MEGGWKRLRILLAGVEFEGGGGWNSLRNVLKG